ncbi:hypothetical protein K503DRAFT_765375 [Rhizopogon vinicolor AM-OR11-026]|uniref:Uncharacterized protein n=1 Tax=Rhizopogon vinicolor AM-OR11-026 TaxID=1314800 RepID=A0A1B7NGQ6_9AGAM|nr:hypothetical protein K503DRAFT_765375 [Rhizopogon vinicolor AM-OR11-026]
MRNCQEVSSSKVSTIRSCPGNKAEPSEAPVPTAYASASPINPDRAHGKIAQKNRRQPLPRDA